MASELVNGYLCRDFGTQRRFFKGKYNIFATKLVRWMGIGLAESEDLLDGRLLYVTDSE